MPCSAGVTGVMMGIVDWCRQVQGGQGTPLAQAVAAQMNGVRRVTISALGVLLEEWQPSELQVFSPSLLLDPRACCARPVSTCNFQALKRDRGLRN